MFPELSLNNLMNNIMNLINYINPLIELFTISIRTYRYIKQMFLNYYLFNYSTAI